MQDVLGCHGVYMHFAFGRYEIPFKPIAVKLKDADTRDTHEKERNMLGFATLVSATTRVLIRWC